MELPHDTCDGGCLLADVCRAGWHMQSQSMVGLSRRGEKGGCDGGRPCAGRVEATVVGKRRGEKSRRSYLCAAMGVAASTQQQRQRQGYNLVPATKSGVAPVVGGNWEGLRVATERGEARLEWGSRDRGRWKEDGAVDH